MNTLFVNIVRVSPKCEDRSILAAWQIVRGQRKTDENRLKWLQQVITQLGGSDNCCQVLLDNEETNRSVQRLAEALPDFDDIAFTGCLGLHGGSLILKEMLDNSALLQTGIGYALYITKQMRKTMPEDSFRVLVRANAKKLNSVFGTHLNESIFFILKKGRRFGTELFSVERVVRLWKLLIDWMRTDDAYEAFVSKQKTKAEIKAYATMRSLCVEHAATTLQIMSASTRVMAPLVYRVLRTADADGTGSSLSHFVVNMTGAVEGTRESLNDDLAPFRHTFAYF